MIRVSHLIKSFSGQRILDNIDLDIKDGELLVIIGGSGAGKSVLLQHLIGLFKPDSGEIFIDGQEITCLPEKELLKVRRKMGYLFQEGALYDFMNVYENVAFPLREHTDLDEAAIKKKVEDMLEIVDLKDVEEKFPSELSGGMKKRVALARCIILGSKIIFCDEPTSGLDPIRSRDISDLIKNVSRKMKCTTVVTSHDIDNSMRIADRVVIIKDGKLVAVGSPEEIKKDPNEFVQEFINA